MAFPTTNEILTIIRESGVSLEGGETVQAVNLLRPVYSKEIMLQALPVMRFYQFAKVHTELLTTPGVTIKMMTFNNLKRGSALTEGVRMKTQALNSAMKDITVQEYGNAVSVTEMTLKASFVNVMEQAVIQLSRDLALVVDILLRDTALAGGDDTSTIYGRQTGGAKIAARNAIAKDVNTLTVATIKDALEILATNNAPRWNADYYICFVHPHQSRTLRDDPAWINISNYGAPTAQFYGEIGRIDNVRFIETTLMCNGAAAEDDDAYKADLHGAGADDADVYQAVLFGENYYGFAIGMEAEIRDGGIIDFSREHSIAWYGIFGAGCLNPEYGVVIETA